MRLGPLEISIVVGVTILIGILTRICQFKDYTTKRSQESPPKNVQQEVQKRTQRIYRHLKLAGIVLVITGIVLLFAGIGFFKWAISAYAWSFVIAAIGLLLMFFMFGRR